MQSENSEEVDTGTALLRTWREAAWQSVRECTQGKVSVSRCIYASDLEVRRRGGGGWGSYWEFYSMAKEKKTFESLYKM